MNILMLGNGFDLHHSLPTTYICFLKTVEYIINNDIEPHSSVGTVFSEVAKDCSRIEKCYKHYKSVYDELVLDPFVVSKIKTIGKDNVWLNYFIDTYNKDVGWIDLETEIEMVANTIEEYLPLLSDGNLHNADKAAIYILKYFGFFIETKKMQISNNRGVFVITPEQTTIKKCYTIEYPLGSGKLKYDYDKIINDLYDKLRDLVLLLNLYLTNFVDKILNKNIQSCTDDFCSFIKQCGNDQSTLIISLNYTSTLEFLYDIIPSNVIHIHGSVGKENMVLGVNSNSVTKNNYSLKFRKYYQRTMYDTDNEYNQFLYRTRVYTNSNVTIIGKKDKNILSIFGHSLDISDRDIIEELFKRSDAINIYYHDYKSKDKYIRNLIQIFGKEEFENLRISKALSFINI